MFVELSNTGFQSVCLANPITGWQPVLLRNHRDAGHV